MGQLTDTPIHNDIFFRFYMNWYNKTLKSREYLIYKAMIPKIEAHILNTQRKIEELLQKLAELTYWNQYCIDRNLDCQVYMRDIHLASIKIQKQLDELDMEFNMIPIIMEYLEKSGITESDLHELEQCDKEVQTLAEQFYGKIET